MKLLSQSKGRILLPLIFTLIAGFSGGFLVHSLWGPGHSDRMDASSDLVEKEILYWVAPMDSGYRRDGPGKSPMGMDLVPVYADEGSETDYVQINGAVEQSLGVRTSKAERRSLWRKVEATGYIDFDESSLSQINLRTEGWIERLLVKNEGERVKKGQLLFEYYSPQLVNAQREYVQASRRGDAQILSASEEKLLALGVGAADIRQLAKTLKASNTIQVLAPQDGTVTRLNVREGVFVRPATSILELADLSSVWLQVGVFESQVDWVTVGQSAEASLNYIPGEVFSGKVDYVYPVLDRKTRTLQVRLQFDNPDERLKPNMYARVTIFGKAHPSALSIPREALIRGQDSDRVVVSLGDGKYTVREVMSGIESGSWIEIVAGLEQGDEVVTSAQFLIDSEASLTGSIQRLSDTSLPDNSSRTYFASGTVKAINAETRQLRVSHGPIEALGWAAMTMEFAVLPEVDLGNLNVGQGIHFELGQSEIGDYQINLIHSSGKDMSHQSHAIIKDDEKDTQTIFAMGTVEEVYAEKRKIRLSHGPIDELGWMAMTMDFSVMPAVDLSKLQPGDSIHFGMEESETGAYRISVIHRMGGEGDEESTEEGS
jgi:Cu(I)/Ag(I) efflux system membrane fusion protein